MRIDVAVQQRVERASTSDRRRQRQHAGAEARHETNGEQAANSERNQTKRREEQAKPVLRRIR